MADWPVRGTKPWDDALKAYIDASIPERTRFSVQRTTPASVWNINHNLNAFPSVVLLLDDDPTHPVSTDVTYVDANNVSLSFPTPVTGWAYLN